MAVLYLEKNANMRLRLLDNSLHKKIFISMYDNK
jgi:hypothetical protein